MEWSVIFKTDLLSKINFDYFSQIFPGHLLTSTSLFFNKIEEDNIFLIYNSTLWANKVSLFILAMINKPVTILCFNELNDSDSPVLFHIREIETEDERKLQKYFFREVVV